MGLLDGMNLNSGIDPQTALLLGLGSGLLGTVGQGRRATFGEALSAGLMSGTQSMRQAIADRQRAEQLASENESRRQTMQLAQAAEQRQAQMFPSMLRTQELNNTKTQAELDALQRQQRLAEQAMQWRASLGNPTSPTEAASRGGPTVAAAQNIGQMPSAADTVARLRQGVLLGLIKPEEAKAIVESSDWGRPEVARVLEVRGADGMPRQRQLDKFGSPVGSDVDKPFEQRQVDMGSAILGINPYTGQSTGVSYTKSMTPGEQASNALGWANNRISQGQLDVARFNATKPVNQDGVWLYPPTADNPRGAMVVPPGMSPPKGSEAAQQRSAAQALEQIAMAEKLLPAATGSYAGKGFDMLAQAVGRTTEGAQAAQQLKVIQGWLTLNTPRFEGPQSDKDTSLYRELTGMIGDETIPVARRMAALQTAKQVFMKYAGPAAPLRFNERGELVGN